MSNEDLLKLLEAHGQQFLQSFDTPVTIGKRKEGPTTPADRSAKKKKEDEPESEEEWAGIGHRTGSSEAEEDSDEEFDEDEASEDEDGDDEDDEFTYESGSHQPNVVVFSETVASMIPRKSKSGFMSAKVSKLTEEVTKSSKKKSSEDDDDDLTNAQNDALLHRLVHTKLLSGSLNPDLELTPAQRKKALAGRLLEAAGKAKLGKGEASVRQKEHNRAAKHVRDGLAEKKKERRQKQLEEAKQLGNYHPALKALYDGSSTSNSRSRKRERGLKMGVGSFKGGILKLGKRDINAVEGMSSGRRGRGSHRRGGKR